MIFPSRLSYPRNNLHGEKTTKELSDGARNERFSVSRKLSRSIVRVHFGIPCRITRYVTIPSELVKNSPFASRAIFPGYSVPCGEYRSDRCTSVEFFWRPRGGEYRETRLSTLLPPGFQPLRVLRDARKLARERGEKRDGGGRGGEGGEDDE